MKIIDVESEPIHKNPHGVDARRIYNRDHGQAIHIELNTGQSLNKHITPVDVFFYVLEGTATVEIGDEIQEVEQDHLVESPAKIPHRVMNISNSKVRFLVVKMPRPAEPTKIL
ncbi:Cupin 2 conserved barrel domain protein [Methanosalsum zhilinae DSM 4017]|uniref:Cupin 2 conserved barrel domain protein n=1 Tax=Methanosalsum zhilinae (strain DSM 4017 / NBRC 107636 / OCM 62 / WeN5) TaxID=679901 RepID=F7XPL5_METZD|nr:cupin domain-containing protein [Methanosalsum zhilinae]AEH61447.1 Cupin 2 conserved barrel domain protein [Methanosalsum zhilinae DSM 4017]